MNGATHTSGNMLDLIISHRESKLDVKILSIINLFSDHCVIPISINSTIQPLIKRVIYYRNIASINIHNNIIKFMILNLQYKYDYNKSK